MNKIYLVSVSGGKDSTAIILYMLSRRSKEQIVFSYFDTGWEHPSVYEYLDYLEKTLQIKINRVGGITFEELCEREEYIPNYTARFCSRVLKHEKGQELVKKYKEAGYDVYVVTGVRRDESKARATYTTRNRHNGDKIIQPIVYWTAQDVFNYLKKHNIEANPLYKQGWSRVGCYPCIFVRQTEIGRLEPWAIKRVQDLEKKISAIRGKKISFFKEDIDSKVRRSSAYNALGLDLGCISQYGECG